jgi:hypothetical protein
MRGRFAHGSFRRRKYETQRIRVLALFVLALTVSLPLANAENGASSAAMDKSAQKKEANALKWKERILKVPVGSYVKAKLENHAEFEGQLRDISDSGFSIQLLKGNKIETMAIQYEDLKSLSVAGRPSTGGKVGRRKTGVYYPPLEAASEERVNPYAAIKECVTTRIAISVVGEGAKLAANRVHFLPGAPPKLGFAWVGFRFLQDRLSRTCFRSRFPCRTATTCKGTVSGR